MAGSEIGSVNEQTSLDITAMLMVNRELALEDATARAERVVFDFRRQGVFDRTFRRRLDSYNRLVGFTEVAECGFVPEGYHDPRAEL